jgi:hypothetical protein
MPNNIINSFAEKSGKSKEEVEQLWDKAKEIAAKENKAEDYAYITGILKKMLKLNESGFLTIKDIIQEGLIIESNKRFEVSLDGVPKILEVGKNVQVRSLKVGQLYYYKTKREEGFFRFSGFSNAEEKHGGSGPIFKDLKTVMKKYDVKNTKELENLDQRDGYEYGQSIYLCGSIYTYYKDKADLDSLDGCYFYLYNGRWSLGSSGEALSFKEVREIQ